MKRFFAAAAFALAVCAAPRPAAANGRFPASNQLFFSPKDDQLIIVRTTFGLLVSHDRGGTWDWVCDQSIPLVASEDPMLAFTESGAIIATTFSGVSISKDDACDFQSPGGEVAERVFVDTAADPSNRTRIVVFASSYDHQEDGGALRFVSKLWETTDDGKTFTALGPELDPTLLGDTVDLVAGDPDRVYISAIRDPGASATGYFLLSTDHGKTYKESPIALQDKERGAYIAGIDPSNPDRIYVRTEAGVDKPTRLLVSDDTGATWKTVYAAKGPLLGFALSTDGKRVYVGGPKDGIRVASTTDFAFEQTSKVEAQCLAIGSDGLWACSNEPSGFIVALSKDDGVTFDKKTHFCDIRGPLACGAGSSTGDTCPELWTTQRSFLGCDVADEGGVPEASAEAGFAPPDRVTPGGGCDCRSSRGAAPAAFVTAGLSLLALSLVTRKRRRR